MTTENHDNEQVPPVEEQLEQILRDAERALAELREALAEQRLRAQQHREIDRLPEHLANTTVKWKQVRGFFDEVISELKGRDDDRNGNTHG